jgi:hypothetical protein
MPRREAFSTKSKSDRLIKPSSFEGLVMLKIKFVLKIYVLLFAEIKNIQYNGVRKIFAIFLIIIASMSHADWGVNSIRVQCIDNSVVFEPFIAWNGGNSPYQEFSGEIANEHSFATSSRGRFYSLKTSDVSGECSSRVRKIKFSATRPAGVWLLTVIEEGKIAVDRYSFEKAFVGNFNLTVESELKGKWKFCESEIIDQVTSPKSCKSESSDSSQKINAK